MTPSARIKAVLDLLEKIEKSPIPMDLTIGDYMRNRRYIGSKDRSYIAETTYAVIRHHARLLWALEKAASDPTPRNRLIAYLRMTVANANLDDLFDGTKHGPLQLTDEEKQIVARLPQNFDTAPDDVRCECPPEYRDSLHSYFGNKFHDELSALIAPAYLNLRTNIVMAPRERAKEMLAEDKVRTEENKFSPWGLSVGGKTFLSMTRAFKKGLVEIQDEGSQLIALACDVKPGQQVLDYCAGAGGKTLALAAAMGIKGRIVAMDLEASRLAKARERFRRAKVSDIIEPRPLSDEKNRKWLRRQKQSFDCVLIDVPCSGTGTWRRNPDMRWRTYGPSVEELVPIQREIMEKVAGTVKEGGRLVYATCSMLPEENETQVEGFLKDHPEFELANLKDVWPDGCTPPCDGKYMRLTPLRHGTDGFFAAIMIRK
ncbi:MAG TPA: RsmB/NOP family class I SAM-dependent RNA methyltransferase [Alphaproteobacteria bacterium]|nr:RsmB/NOP family class I SAM-dependent RNA methyltransferase [Alphaproteobacteria bacterium]HNS43809.1 RsmB/NOP family class I SAM-dependent RNA methyltransferase [Alphaproteobacteria bacterium]